MITGNGMKFIITHQLHQGSPEIAFSSCTVFFTSLTTAHLPLQVLLSITNLGRYNPSSTVSQNPLSIYTPNRDLSVDEAMIPFKGRSTLKQYMPQKPVKRGIKVWALADAINGFVSMFQVYTGKQGNTVQKGLGANVVTTLTKPYVNTFRHVYFDNFFTIVDLLLDLYQSGLYGCGTVRTNRKGFPQQLKPIVKKGMKERGESKTYQHKKFDYFCMARQ